MKLEQQQRMESVSNQTQDRSKFSGPRVVRGGHHGSAPGAPNSPPSPSSAVLRGGGGGSMGGGAKVFNPAEPLAGSKINKQDSAIPTASSNSSGLLSFFKGQGTKN